MKKQIGVWIDYLKAVVVIIRGKGEEVKEITSHMEEHVRFSSGINEDGSIEEGRDRQYESYLNDYYDAVIAAVRGGDTIQIYGPGEVKSVLEKRLEDQGLGDHIVRVGTIDKMTDRQVAAKVREYVRRQKAQSKGKTRN